MKTILIVFMLLVITVDGWSQELWDYKKVKNWHYDLKVEIIILMPEDFVDARNYYFDLEKYPDRERVSAFTTWYKVDGEWKPFMFTKMRINLAPSNDDFGHEIKHIINHEHKKVTGEYLFPLPCNDWR